METRRLQGVSGSVGADQNRTGELALTRKLRTSEREREDEERRARHDDFVDPWGYDCWHEDGWEEL